MDLIGAGDLTSPLAEEDIWNITCLAAGQPFKTQINVYE